MVTGIAFHWYSGDHFEALELVRNQFPDKKMIISEAVSNTVSSKRQTLFMELCGCLMKIIGDLNHGMTAFYDWNLLLDEQGGPNHVGNYCHAPFLYDRNEKSLMPRCYNSTLNIFLII